MAQPEGEGDEDYRLTNRDDNRPAVLQGDTDKGHEIVGVPEELDPVVDLAVNYIRRVIQEDIDADLDTIVEYIDICLIKRKPGDTTFVPQEFVDIINELNIQVSYYYNSLLTDAIKASDAIFNILNQYCKKVKGIIAGCLIATLQLEDDAHLGLLISELDVIASQLRQLLISKVELPASKGDVSERVNRFLSQLMEAYKDRVRVEISLKQRDMLSFLEQKTDEVSLMILTRIEPPQTESGTQDEGEKFAEQFGKYKCTYNAILELFQSQLFEKKMAELSIDKPERERKDTGVWEQQDTVWEQQNFDFAATPPPKESAVSDTILYITSLKDDATDRSLFDLVKEYGTLLHVKAPIQRQTGKSAGYGFVKFAEPKDANKALEGLSQEKVQKSMEGRSPELIQSQIIIRELPTSANEDYLRHMCQDYGRIEEAYVVQWSPNVFYGFVTFSTDTEAVKALSGLQSSNHLAMLNTYKSTRRAEVQPEKGGEGKRMGYGAEGGFQYVTGRSQRRAVSDTLLYIHPLKEDTSERMLFEQFKQYGTILFVRAVTDQHRNYGSVLFAEPGEARKALDEVTDLTLKKSWSDRTPELEKRRIIIKDLQPTITTEQLGLMCKRFGNVIDVNLVAPRQRIPVGTSTWRAQPPFDTAVPHRPLRLGGSTHRPPGQAGAHRPPGQAGAHRPPGQAGAHRPPKQAGAHRSRPPSGNVVLRGPSHSSGRTVPRQRPPYGFVEFASDREAIRALKGLQSRDMLAMLAKPMRYDY